MVLPSPLATRSASFPRSFAGGLAGLSVALAACGGDTDPPPEQPAAATGSVTAGAAAISGRAGAAATTAGRAAAGAAGTRGSPTFSAIFQEIIVGKGCNGGPTCHASTAAGQLKMALKNDAYTALVGVQAMGVNLVMTASPACKDSMLARVVAGDPSSSLLYEKVSSTMPACGGKMPPNGAMLAPEKIEQIRTWIMNGARND
jgi:hypothetical protein